jgi:hypothetical protein
LPTLKRRIVIFVIRAIGTLSGLLGVLMLYSIYIHAIAVDDIGPWFKYIFLVGVPLVFALIFFWIAYLVWFRFSPRAVQQVCGLLGFLLMSFIMTEYHPTDKANAFQPLVVYIGSMVFVLVGYKVLTRYLNAIVFGGESTSADKPPMS